MNEEQEKDGYERNSDFPHEFLLDDLDVSISSLSASTQRDIENFDSQYMNAVIDGGLSNEEKQVLILASYEITKKIHLEVGGQAISNARVTGIFTGVVLAIATILGINQITKP